MSKIVKYGNDINSLNFSQFTANDFDFFFGICSELQEKDDNEITLSFSYIKKLINYKETDNKRFVIDIERMYDKIDNIVYRKENANEILKFRFFSKFHLLKNENEVKISVSKEFVPLLNNLKEQFTLFELKQFTQLSSKHSKTLFRICKQWKTIGKTKMYNIDELKIIFDCQNYENKNFTRLLKKVVEELNNKKFFVNLLCIPKIAEKKGSPVIGYTFTFDPEVVPQKSQEEDLELEKAAASSSHSNNSNYKKPVYKNRFNDFTQTYYDFDALEREILSN